MSKDAEWSLDVKANAGWRCQTTNCEIGALDHELLESHHIEPVSVCPEKRYDLDNGTCRCIYDHALKHTGRTRLLIMARGFLILLGRLYPQRKAEFRSVKL